MARGQRQSERTKLEIALQKILSSKEHALQKIQTIEAEETEIRQRLKELEMNELLNIIQNSGKTVAEVKGILMSSEIDE